MSGRWLWLWLWLVPMLTSCASTARITGDFGDYSAYREARLSTTLEERLGASERYLRKYPHGDYHEEIRAWFAPREKHYVKLSWNNLPRLRAYLDEMPHGPHAELVTERIGELETRKVYADRREQRMLSRAQGFEAQLAEAAEQRRTFLRELSLLTKLLGATRTFDQPTSELAPEFLVRFRAWQPAGHCDGDLCTKSFSFSYAVPEDKTLSPRTAQLTLEIILERGLVQQLAWSGPELLSRVAEAVTVRAVPPNDPQARAEAFGQALDVIAAVLDGPLPGARCSVEAVSPIVLSRRCEGVRLDVVAGTEPGEPDRLVVRAESH